MEKVMTFMLNTRANENVPKNNYSNYDRNH